MEEKDLPSYERDGIIRYVEDRKVRGLLDALRSYEGQDTGVRSEIKNLAEINR